MARREAPKINPIDLYEEKIVYCIEFLENSAFGRFLGQNVRVHSPTMALQFEDYDSARDAIVARGLENVGIVKAWV